MSETPLTAIYLCHRRGEHEYREFVILPATGAHPMNYWSRYISHKGARPVWRGTRNLSYTTEETRTKLSLKVVDSVDSTIAGHIRQNERNGSMKQWVWDAPIIVEVTPDEVHAGASKTPYAVLRRVTRVMKARESTAAATS